MLKSLLNEITAIVEASGGHPCHLRHTLSNRIHSSFDLPPDIRNAAHEMVLAFCDYAKEQILEAEEAAEEQAEEEATRKATARAARTAARVRELTAVIEKLTRTRDKLDRRTRTSAPRSIPRKASAPAEPPPEVVQGLTPAEVEAHAAILQLLTSHHMGTLKMFEETIPDIHAMLPNIMDVQRFRKKQGLPYIACGHNHYWLETTPPNNTTPQ